MFQQTATKYQKLSRSKIDLFVQCELCFYLDRVKGIPRPSGLPFTLNSAVDTVLKTEFDVYREKGARHPLMEKYAVDAVPAKHPKLDIWRQNFKGIRYDHDDSQLTITGAIDDLWLNFNNEYIIVDYKSTSKAEQITRLDKEWHAGYKRQMEIYQWLFAKSGFKVSSTGYFVYCNAITSDKTFDNKLDFEVTLIPYTGDYSWVDSKLLEIRECLNSDNYPNPNTDCDVCKYYDARYKDSPNQLNMNL